MKSRDIAHTGFIDVTCCDHCHGDPEDCHGDSMDIEVQVLADFLAGRLTRQDLIRIVLHYLPYEVVVP